MKSLEEMPAFAKAVAFRKWDTEIPSTGKKFFRRE
jgi:hypothetical protein